MTIRYITKAGVLVVLLIAGVSLYAGWYAYVGSQSARAARLAADVRAQQSAQAQAQVSRDALAKAEQEQARIAGYFVSQADIVPFLETLQRTGAAQGARVEVVSVSAEAAQPRSRILLSLSITGPFDSVLRTLGALEYGPYDIVLSSVTLDTSGSGSAAEAWSASATLRVGTSEAIETTTTP